MTFALPNIYMEMANYIKRKELAKLLGCSPQMVSKLSNSGKIPFIRLGSEPRYNPEEVIKALQTRSLQNVEA
jgi:excisionase family DNA binding protein